MRHRSTALWLAATGIAAITSEASAQEAASSSQPAVQSESSSSADGAQGELIVVTAQKRTQALIDVPQSVSVISGDALEDQHARRLSDYLTKIPSANIVESQAGNSRIVLRGINTGGVGATVATYIDETPVGSATALANGGVLAADIDPSDLARVEVLRGPQGTLYGANSLGGLVKYVTIAPSTGRLEARAEAGVENVAHGDAGWWVRGAGNVPLSDQAAVRVSGFHRRDPGYIDDPSLGNNVNDGDTYGGRVSLLFKPVENLRIRASALLENIRSNGTNIVDLDPVTLEPSVGKLDHVRIVDEPSDIDYRVYNATIDYDFGPVTLLSSTSFGTLDQAQIVDASGVYGPILSFVFGIPLGAAVDQGMEQDRFTQEIRLASSSGTAVEWTLGGFYTHEKNRLSQNLFGVDALTGDNPAPLDGLILVDLPSKYEEIAGFANATWHISPKFDVDAGARLSHNKQSDEQSTAGPLAGGGSSFDGKSSDSVFTYSLAPTFKPNDNTRIYARIAKGYRPGGPNAVSPLAPDGVPRHFDPDTTINYEVGVKAQTDDRLFTAELTAFLIDWKDIQLLVQIEGFGVNTNGPSARSKGFEFNVGLNPVRGLSLYANGSYVDAYLTKDAPILVGGVKGDPLPYNPKWQGTIGVDYEHPLSGTLTARGGFSWHYTGSRHADFSPGTTQRKLGDFSQVDAHAGLDFGHFGVDAFVHNLTDARGIVNIGFFGSPTGDLAASVVRPRSFGLVLSADY
ncbi:MAG TPA: TonB-dependent receptor [Sphingomicrobium sp.]|nr:TonB-dependent receptor [Sphingomicrobium sp.]